MFNGNYLQGKVCGVATLILWELKSLLPQWQSNLLRGGGLSSGGGAEPSQGKPEVLFKAFLKVLECLWKAAGEGAPCEAVQLQVG